MSLFEYDKKEILIQEKINDMYIINIITREFRKENTMFFSKISMYKQMGYIFNNSFHILKNYMKCINCYSNYENDDKCNYCDFKYSNNKNCFFLNIRHVIPSKEYIIIKNLFNLDYIYNYYNDQRFNMDIFMKQEIISNALHPDRIEKILKLTNDEWYNLEKYI